MHAFTANVQKMELSNSCSDVPNGDGPLNFNLTLSSDFPALSQYQFSDQLQAQLKLNFSLIPKIPNQRIDSINIMVNISSTPHTQWTGGRNIQLAIDRAEVPEQVMERIKSNDKERFRAQAKLVFNRVTAGEWSPICESSILQPCLDSE